jgi:hypothetical protein
VAKTLTKGILFLAAASIAGCSSQPLSHSDAKAALISLVEAQDKPIFSLTIPGLRSGVTIRYVTGKEEGISSGTWHVDLSKKTFLFLAADDTFYYSCSGVFCNTEGEWQAEIETENEADAPPNNDL